MSFETREGTECIVRNYRELQFNNFAVDNTNQRIAATVQKTIAILDLEKPDGPQPLKKLGRQNKFDIRVLEWNHSEENCNLLASTSQNKLDVWDAETSRDPLHSVKAHSRAVSDLNWSYSDAHCLASCSVDSFVYTWDVRDLRKPKLSFKAVAGASCVRWNRLDSHILASAHDSDIRIWDSRNPSTAVGYISAHVSKIYGLDWSYLDNKRLTTWSQDATVKFWDISSTREPLHVLKGYSSPVWKALNTPFGHGLVVSLAQHMHGSGDERIFLQSSGDATTPLHIFNGHTDSILDIQWRFIDKDNYSLISWSRDCTLRLWEITAAMKQGCMLENNEEPTRSPSVVSSSALTIPKPPSESTGIAAFSPSSDPSLFSQQPVQTLEQEFSLLNLDIPNLVMERLDAAQRSCTMKIVNDSQMVRLCITFPSHYPNAAPAFILDSSTTIDTAQRQELLQKLQDTAQKFMKQNRPCLQVCIKLLANTLQSFSARPVPPLMRPAPFEGATLQDDHIPFPRSSGARFCSSGILVVFNRPVGLVLPTADDKKTPRSVWQVSSYYMQRNLSHLSSFVAPPGSPVISNTLQVPPINRRAKKLPSIIPYVIKEPHRKTSKNPFVGLVIVMDASSLLPVSQQLAKNYVLQAGSIKEMCQYNAVVASSANRPDLVKAWSVTTVVADTDGPVSNGPDDEEFPWPMHPFARPLIHSLFSHYGKIYDIQTMAMLSCVFHTYDKYLTSILNEDHVDDNGFTIVPQQAKVSSPAKIHGSNNSMNDFEEFENLEEEEESIHKMNCKLLDEQLINRCNEMIRCYSNVLYCWKMFSLRAELLSFTTQGDSGQMNIGFLNKCNKCTHPVNRPSCEYCKCLSLSCSICHVSVKGISSFCPQCGHGGHLFHMLEWFTNSNECPTGCGCNCGTASYSLTT